MKLPDLAGQAVLNPLGCEEPAWVLNVLSVDGPDAGGMVTISAVEGQLKCCGEMDWDGLVVTPQVAALMEEIVAVEKLRFLEPPPLPPAA